MSSLLFLQFTATTLRLLGLVDSLSLTPLGLFLGDMEKFPTNRYDQHTRWIREQRIEKKRKERKVNEDKKRLLGWRRETTEWKQDNTNVFFSFIFYLPSSIFHLPSSIFHLPSSIFHLPSSIFHLPSSIFHLPSSIFHLPSSIFFGLVELP